MIPLTEWQDIEYLTVYWAFELITMIHVIGIHLNLVNEKKCIIFASNVNK